MVYKCLVHVGFVSDCHAVSWSRHMKHNDQERAFVSTSIVT